MSRKSRVVSAAVIHVKHKSHIQDLCLKFCIFTILAEHHQNIFRCGQFRFRRIDIEILSSAVIIRMISVYHQHRKLTDEVQTLTENVRNTRIIRFLVIRIKLQDTSRNAVHHIAARRFHDDVTHEVRRKHTALCDHILKLFQLCFIRKFAEQKQVRRLLKSRVIRLEESSDKIFDIITSVIQIPLTRYRLSVYDF